MMFKRRARVERQATSEMWVSGTARSELAPDLLLHVQRDVLDCCVDVTEQGVQAGSASCKATQADLSDKPARLTLMRVSCDISEQQDHQHAIHVQCFG